MNLRILLLLAVALYVMWGLFLYAYQRNFMYLPVGKVPHDYPVEQFVSQGETIEVVVLNGGKPHAVIYFGGNAESVVANAPGFLHALPGTTVYLVNYRGYAGSSGTPTERGLYADALHIFDTVQNRHQGVSVIGRSLGSGVATYLAANRPVERLALVTPFDSILHIVQNQYPVFPVSLMLKDRYDSLSRVPDIAAQTLIVIAEHDMVVPAKYSLRLAEAFSHSQASVVTMDGAGHNGLSGREGYYRLLGRFVAGPTVVGTRYP